MINIQTLKQIIDDSDITDEVLSVLLNRAKQLAINHYFWKSDDRPTAEDKQDFVDRYEYEIYGVAVSINDSDNRNGLKSYTELGITRTWESGGNKSVETALASIPTKTYVG